MSKQFTVVIERDTQGYSVASVPALPGCHTQAKSRDELNARIKEAIMLCLDVGGEDTPSLELITVERVTVAA